jgi:hypothetical protein
MAKDDELDRARARDFAWRTLQPGEALHDELHEPHAAAADPAPEVAQRARALWLAGRGEPCPVDELAGVETGVLAAPASARMLERLSLLRTAPQPAPRPQRRRARCCG